MYVVYTCEKEFIMKTSNLIKTISISALFVAGFLGTKTIFSNKKSVEATAATNTTVYYAISSSDLGSHTLKLNVNFKGDGDDWHSYEMSKTNKMIDGKRIYSASFTDAYDGLGKLQFQQYDGGSWRSQEEPISSWTSASTYNGKMKIYGQNGWQDYTYDTVLTRYVIGVFNSVSSWSVDKGFAMEYDSGNQEYVGTVELKYGDVFKVAYYNGSSFQDYYGYNDVSSKSPASFCFGDDHTNDHNIKVWASGSYKIYSKDAGHGGSETENRKLYLAFNGEARNAEQLAAKLMSYGGTDIANEGKCISESRYSTCKDMFSALSADERRAFLSFATSQESQFRNAYDRLVAWAAANGEYLTEDANGPVFSGSNNRITLFNKNSNNNTCIILIVSIAALSAISGYVFYKKRKEIN